METMTERILDLTIDIDFDIPEGCETTDKPFEDFDAQYKVRYDENGKLYSEYDFSVEAGYSADITDIIDTDMKTENISEYEIFDIQDMGDHITAKIRIKN